MVKIRLNLRKVAAITACLAVCMMFSSCTVLAQGGIAKTAQTTLKIGESYNLRISSEQFSDFKIVTSEDGSLTLSFKSFAECTFFAIFNENGTSFMPTSREIVTEGKGYCTVPYNRADWYGSRATFVGFNNQDQVVGCSWNPTVERFEGSFTFKLDAGTYYVRIIRGQTGLSNANLTISMKDLYGNEVK